MGTEIIGKIMVNETLKFERTVETTRHVMGKNMISRGFQELLRC